MAVTTVNRRANLTPTAWEVVRNLTYVLQSIPGRQQARSSWSVVCKTLNRSPNPTIHDDHNI